MTRATPVTVHQERPPKANVNEPGIYALRVEKESGKINGEGDYKFVFSAGDAASRHLPDQDLGGHSSGSEIV